MKRFLSKAFKYSGLKSLYFICARNKNGRLIKCPIFLYHSIGNDTIPPQLFEQHLDFLCSAFSIIPLREVYQGITSGNLPPKPLVVSFDDGYRDNYELALPILEKHHIVCTIFITTGYIGGKLWGKPVMTQEQIKDLVSRGMEIAAHTVSHPNLRRLNHAELRAELAMSKTKLEEIIEGPVVSLSYPYGLYNRQVTKIAREVGFKIAVTTVHDFFLNREKLLECPRLPVYPNDSHNDLQAKLDGDQHWLKLAHRLYLPLLYRRL